MNEGSRLTFSFRICERQNFKHTMLLIYQIVLPRCRRERGSAHLTRVKYAGILGATAGRPSQIVDAPFQNTLCAPLLNRRRNSSGRRSFFLEARF